jgi:protein TonB
LGVGGDENADAPIDLASVSPPRPRRDTQQRREPVPAPAPAQDDPVPVPQTSWSGPGQSPAANNSASGGPVSLIPGQQAANSSGGPATLSPPAAALTAPAVVENPVTATAAVSASVTRPPPRAAGAVVWAQRPSARRIADIYPARAQREGTGGRAELDCTVRADLSLACAVASETPAGGGFGRAALAASNAYRTRPTLSDGSAAAGARTRIAIVFQPPAE